VCPVDNQPLNSDKDLFPDNFTRREIQELDIKNQQVSKDCCIREMFLTELYKTFKKYVVKILSCVVCIHYMLSLLV